MSARGRVPCGGVSGRTHGSAPTRWGRRPETNGNWCGKRRLPNGVGRSPPPTGGSGSGPAAGRAWGVAGCGHPALREQRRWCVAAGRRGRRPLRKGEQAALTTLARGAERSVCASGWEEGVGIAAEIIPKVSSNAGQSLSHGCAVPALFTQGSLALRGTGVRAAGVVGPYGKPNPPPKPAGAQRSVRARGREGWAGIGAKTIPKRGPLPRLPGQRLAKRKARKEHLVKFDLCPVTSECSTGYRVRRSAEDPARAHAEAASTEQNSLAPHPVVQEDAKRPGCTTGTRFFF